MHAVGNILILRAEKLTFVAVDCIALNLNY